MNNFQDSTQIPVRTFHQIVLWPVLIENPPDSETTPAEPLESAASCLTRGAWGWLDPDQGSKKVSEHDEYDEVVYFHPFVREFLYGDGDTEHRRRAMRVLSRDDVRSVEIVFDDTAIRLAVPRVRLYLFETSVAVLVVEICSELGGAELSLADILTIQEGFRHVYPAYWEEFEPHRPGACPRHVRWLDAEQQPVSGLSGSDYEQQALYREFTAMGAEPPVSAHWSSLLEPWKPFQRAGRHVDAQIAYRQVVDERMPSMTFVAVDDPRQISKADMARLAFVDQPGNPRTPVYAEEFLEASLEEVCYDRFWSPRPKVIGEEPVSDADREAIQSYNDRMTTRYLCSGYAFVALGRADGFYDNVIRRHFRNHYFKIGLIVHFQRASLLIFSDHLSEAIRVLRDRKQSLKDKVDRLKQLQEELLWFRSRCWFCEVSNQLQAGELHRLWLDRLGTKQLFDEVFSATHAVNEVLQSQQQSHESHQVRDLTVVATVGLLGSLIVGFVGSRLLVPWVEGGQFSLAAVWQWLLIFLIVAAPLCWLWWWLVRSTDPVADFLFRR